MGFLFDPALDILQWPAVIVPTQVTLHLEGNTTMFTSPFSKGVQTQELPGARFTVSASFPPLTRDQVRVVRAFLAKLRGGARKFYFPAEWPSYGIPASGAAEASGPYALTIDSMRFRIDRTNITIDSTTFATGRPIVTCTGGSGSTITAISYEGIGTIALRAGQHVSYDDAAGWRHLHLVTDDAVIGAGYAISIPVEPPLRTPPANGAPLHIYAPSGIFMLTADTEGQIVFNSDRVGQVSINAAEAFAPRITV